MSKYDEFDLNLQGENSGDGGAEPASITGANCWTIVIGSVLTGCSKECFSAKCTMTNNDCGSALTTEMGCH